MRETPPNIDPVYLAHSCFRRRHFDDCVDICTNLLEKNPLDQAVWFLKCRALTEKVYIDDTDMEDEAIGDTLMDENAISQAPRPGTSLARGGTGSQNANRPVSSSGRPLSGYARPGTQTRGGTSSTLEAQLKNNRGAVTTARPVTSSGRFVRLGTASLLVGDPNGEFISVEKLNLQKYAQRPALAKVLFEYLLYFKQMPMKALELASLCTQAADFRDWWWKAQVGKCYYRLGILRDAERQFISSLSVQDMCSTTLWLCKVFLRLDQPNTALEHYQKAAEKYPGELSLILGIARIYDELNDQQKSIPLYKKVLQFDSSNVEAIACLASNYFYSDQPELALRYYRRLLQMGINNAELWNNLGLCCFYAQQYDMTLSCFERALALADDDSMADVWYNISQVSVGIGDLGLAYQALKIAISMDPNHAESFNNLGVLELRKNNPDQAKANFVTSARLGEHLHEPLFNASLLMYKLGDFQESFKLVSKALNVHPEHEESKEVIRILKEHFTNM